MLRPTFFNLFNTDQRKKSMREAAFIEGNEQGIRGQAALVPSSALVIYEP